MRKLLFLLLFLPLFAVETIKLPNGLKVVLVNRKIPAIFLTVFYRAGAFFDPEGKSGLSYLTGMMSFAGSQKTTPWEQIFFLERVGGRINVNITRDFVIFESYFPKEEFPLGLWYEHERMKPLSLSRSFFNAEKRRLIREAALYEQDEDYKIKSIIYSLLYSNSPYAHRPLNISDSITIQDVENFHSMYFQPPTALMVVIGDLGAREKSLITKMFSAPASRQVLFPEKVEFQSRSLNRKLLVKGLKTKVYARCYRVSSPSCLKRCSLDLAGLYLRRKIEGQVLKGKLKGNWEVLSRHLVYSSSLCVVVKGGDPVAWRKVVNQAITSMKVSPIKRTEFSALKLSYIREIREDELNPEIWGERLGEYSLVFRCSQEEILGGISLLTPTAFWNMIRKSIYPFNRMDVVLMPWEKKP